MATRKRNSPAEKAIETTDEADAALAEWRALPDDRQAEAWKRLRLRLARFVRLTWAMPPRTIEECAEVADRLLRSPRWPLLRPQRPPAGYVRGADA